MKTIEIRSIIDKDYDAAADIIDRIWDYRYFNKSEALCRRKSRKDLIGALLEANYAKVALINNHVAGFLVARVDLLPVSQAPHLLKEYEALVKANTATKDGRLFNDYAELFDSVNRKLRENYNGSLGSEIIYFCTDPEYRSLGAGSALIQDYLGILKRNGEKNVYVHTDSTCNIAFYERLGFTRQGKLTAYAPLRNSEIDFYLYTYALNLE